MKSLSQFSLIAALLVALEMPKTWAAAEITAREIDSAGTTSSNSHVTLVASVGGTSGLFIQPHGDVMLKPGYPGQLSRVVALNVDAGNGIVDEDTTIQAHAREKYDDDSIVLPRQPVRWTILNGPLTGIDSNGDVTAGTVYTDTAAYIQAESGGYTGLTELIVRDVDRDNYGIYAGDMVPDSWQVEYFGESNTNGLAGVDPDHDGENNYFEWVSGVNPTDSLSCVDMRISHFELTACHCELRVCPAYSNRVYEIYCRTNLFTGAWQALSNVSETISNHVCRIIDLGATNYPTYYRVRIVYN